MSARRELAVFAVCLAGLVSAFLGESLFGGKVLSPADVLFVSAAFRDVKGAGYEPANRLLMDPVLQFQPWMEFNRTMFRRGRLPLWNDLAGCGAPHLANGQSAPFDPFHLIAYVGTLPAAYAPMAAARLWFAGLGMFLLARRWGLGPWGRWFAGLAYPLTGFLVLWLLFPVTNVAVWMPWVFLAGDLVLSGPTPRRVGGLGLAVGGLFLGGHVQTSAHALLASGLFVGWRLFGGLRGSGAWSACVRPAAGWAAGVALGLMVAAVSVVPLWVYLGESPVWGDRERERPSPWRVTRPRALDALCTAVPDAFGGQRRGQPNLARALGVNNVNESAGGYAELATLVWLAPQALRAGRRNPYVGFLAGLTALGFLGGFGFPPVVNALRLVPVLNVTDLRRLSLWVAFGLTLLGGIGLDHLAIAWPGRAARWWLSLGAAAVLAMGAGSVAVSRCEPWLRARAEGHYRGAADVSTPSDALARADRQVRAALDHIPRVLTRTAAELAALAALAVLAHRGRVGWTPARLAVLGLTIGGMFRAGLGANPAIDPRDAGAVPEVVARLRSEVGTGGRVLGLGQELLPNVAMRFGLADPRNYDSVELARSLDWFEPLYEPGRGGRSSRRTTSWAGVARAQDRLREASVAAVVAPTPPPVGLGLDAERVVAVWVARLGHEPLAATAPEAGPADAEFDHGKVFIKVNCSRECRLVVRQTFDPGWRAEVDGRPAVVSPHQGTFQSVPLGAGTHRVALVYDPPEVRAACAVSLAGLLLACVAVWGTGTGPGGRFHGLGLGRPGAAGLKSVP